MNHTPTLSETPCTRPQEATDWLSRGTWEELAARAYEMACQEMHPPKSEPFDADGLPWANRSDFACVLADLVCMQVAAAAHQAGVPGFEGEAERLKLWEPVLAATTHPAGNEDDATAVFLDPTRKTLPHHPEGSKSHKSADREDQK